MGMRIERVRRELIRSALLFPAHLARVDSLAPQQTQTSKLNALQDRTPLGISKPATFVLPGRVTFVCLLCSRL